jgi:hypothetical protein
LDIQMISLEPLSPVLTMKFHGDSWKKPIKLMGWVFKTLIIVPRYQIASV